MNITTAKTERRLGLRLLTLLVLAVMLTQTLAPALADGLGLADPTTLYTQIAPNVDVVIIGEDEFYILVQKSVQGQSLKQNITGAKVTVTTSGADGRCKANATKTVDRTDNGMAKFMVEDFRTKEQIEDTKYFYAKVKVEMNGYPTFESEEMRIIGGQKTHVFLDQSAGEPYLRTLSFNGADIMFSQMEVYATPKNDADHTLKAVVQAVNTSGDCRCEIYEGEKNTPEKLLYSLSASKKDDQYAFEFKQKWLKTLKPGKTVIVKFTVGGKEHLLTSGLVVLEPEIPEPETNKDKKDDITYGFSFEKGELKFVIPKGVPLIGEYKVGIAVPNLPVTFYYDTSGKLLLGVIFTYSKEPFSEDPEKKDWKRTNPAKVGDFINESMTKFIKDAKKVKDNVKPLKGKFGHTPFMSTFKLELSFGAMVKGDKIGSKTEPRVMDMVGFISFGGTFSTRKYLMAGPVPFYIGISIKAGITVTAGVTFVTNPDNPMKNFKKTKQKPDPKAKMGEGAMVEIALNVGVSVTLGIGLQDICCVFAEGGVALMPSITIKGYKGKSPEDNKYPHFVCKLNFYLRAGVKILFKTWEIKPICYDLYLADNWHKAPPTLPYWKKIDGPWNPKGKELVTASVTTAEDGEAYAAEDGYVMSMATEEEKAALSLGMYEAPTLVGLAEDERYECVAITPDAAHMGALNETTNQPYQNDALPYDWDETLEQGDDGLGIIVPDKFREIFGNTYQDMRFQCIELRTGREGQQYQKDWKYYRFMFFIAMLNVNGKNTPCVMYGQITDEGTFVDNKVYPMLHKNKLNAADKSVQNITDFSVAGITLTKNLGTDHEEYTLHFEIAAAYSVNDDPGKLGRAECAMGLYNLSMDVEPGESKGTLNYKDFKDINVNSTLWWYRCLMPRIAIKYINIERGLNYSTAIAWLMQYEYYKYKWHPSARPAVAFIFRECVDQNVTWSERNTSRFDTQIGQWQEIYDLAVMADEWNARKFKLAIAHPGPDKDSPRYLFMDDIWPDMDDAGSGRKYADGDNFFMVNNKQIAYRRVSDNHLMLFPGAWFKKPDGNLEERTDTGIVLPSGRYRLMTKRYIHYDEYNHPEERINLYLYWTESQQYQKDPKPEYPIVFPTYDTYNYLKCIVISGKYDKDGITEHLYTTPAFTACALDKRIDYMRLYPSASVGMFDMFYTHMPDVMGQSAKLFFAHVPNVAAAEIPAMTTGDPCISKGEPAQMYMEVLNTGNTFLTKAKLEFTFKYKLNGQERTSTTTKELNLLDCDRMMASTNEFEFDKLADGEYYTMDEELTLSEMLSGEDAALFDEGLDLDWDTMNTGDPNGAGKKLQFYSPGEQHLYVLELPVPKEASQKVNISVKVVGAEYKKLDGTTSTPDGSFDLSLTGDQYGQGEDGTYYAVTTGASCDVGYNDVGLEGALLYDGSEYYLSLSLRNETTNPAKLRLKIYGDNTLLMDEEFGNVCAGVLTDVDGDGEYEKIAAEPEDGLCAANTDLSGFVNLTIPVSLLVQGQEFYQLRAVLVSEDASMIIDGLDEDEVSFVLRNHDPLRITLEPEDQLRKTGDTVTIPTAANGGIAPYAFQWQHYDGYTQEWTNVGNLQTKAGLLEALFASASAEDTDDPDRENAYVIRSFQQADSGLYRCVVTDESGEQVTTRSANISFKQPVTGDGFPLWPMAAMGAMALAALAWLVLRRRTLARRAQ